MKIYLQTEIKKKDVVYEADTSTVIIDTKGGYSREITFLELHGSTSATRAMWAHLVKHRKGNYEQSTGITVHAHTGTFELTIKPGAKFITHTINKSFFIVGEGWKEQQRRYFLGGSETEAPPYFMDSLRINLDDIPILPSWKNHLWKLGLEFGGIEALGTFGMSEYAWKITNLRKWKSEITEGVKRWQD